METKSQLHRVLKGIQPRYTADFARSSKKNVSRIMLKYSDIVLKWNFKTFQ